MAAVTLTRIDQRVPVLLQKSVNPNAETVFSLLWAYRGLNNQKRAKG